MKCTITPLVLSSCDLVVLKLNGYNGSSFNWLGKWNKSDIDTLEMEADTHKYIKDLDGSNRNKYDGLTFVISKPENIEFGVEYNQGTVTIKTPTSTQQFELYVSDNVWNGRQYEMNAL